MSWVDEHYDMGIDRAVEIQYEGRDHDRMDDPLEAANFAYQIGMAEEAGVLETPEGETNNFVAERGDWFEISAGMDEETEQPFLYSTVEVVTEDYEELVSYVEGTDLEIGETYAINHQVDV
jgi:hypothetical protein